MINKIFKKNEKKTKKEKFELNNKIWNSNTCGSNINGLLLNFVKSRTLHFG